MLFRPISSVSLGDDARIAKLLMEGNVWIMDMIHRHFLAEDVHYIVKIKLPS